MSPNLYNIYAEDIMREVLQNYEGGVKIGGVRYSDLRFADDTTLMCSSKSELLELLKQIKEISKKRSLLLNTKKTKIMVVDSNRADIEEFMLGDEKIEEVDNFVYLGSVIDTSCKSSKEIRKRLAMAQTTVQNMLNIWKSRGVSTKLKLRMLHATVFAVATYGCESVAAGTQYKMVLGKQNFVSEANKFLPQTSWGMGGAVSTPIGVQGQSHWEALKF